MKGKIERVSEIRKLKEGLNKKGKSWTLYGVDFVVSGKSVSLTGFSNSKLQEQIEGLPAGSFIEAETEENGGYTNFKGEIKIVSEPSFNTSGCEPVKEVSDVVLFKSKEDVFKEAMQYANKVIDLSKSAEELEARKSIFVVMLEKEFSIGIVKLQQVHKEKNMANFRRD